MYKNGFCFAFVESQNLMHMNAALLASPEGVEGNYWTEMNSIDKLYQKYFDNYERDKTVQIQSSIMHDEFVKDRMNHYYICMIGVGIN